MDDIESSGIKAKRAKKDKGFPTGPKQTTLFGVKKTLPPAKPQHQDSMVSTETEGEADGDEGMEETQVDDRHILEERKGQEVMSPEPLEED